MSRLLPIALLLLLVTGACRSGKHAADSAGRYTPGLAYTAPTDTASNTYGRSVEWTDITLPVKVNISRPTSLRIGGTMTMVNGRDILISLRMFGFEVGAAYVTSDSIYAYVKMQKVYVAESISGLLGGLNLSLSDLQSILIGAPVTIPPTVSGADIGMSVSPATGQPLTISISHPSGGAASIAYAPVEGAPLAEEIALEVVSERSEIAMTLTYDWSRAQVDKGNTRSFSIPRGYRRLSGDALLKSLASQ